MTEASSNPVDSTTRRTIFAWMLFPLALFPLAALLTYDWRAIDTLHNPPLRSTNWIGALGDGFAYWGYTIFGLAIWIVPIVCVIAALCVIRGKRRLYPGRRELWFLLFLSSVSCLLQAVGNGITLTALLHKVNACNAGGAIGYLVMTRALSPLVSDFGAAILMAIVMVASLVGAVGLHNLLAILSGFYNWATARGGMPRSVDGASDGPSAEQERYLAALRAKDEVRRQREEEKQRIREEKIRAKEEKLRLKEEARLAKEQEKLRRHEEQLAGRRGEPAEEPLLPPQPTRQPAAPASSTPPSQPPVEDKGPYVLPSLSLLNPLQKSKADHGDVDEMSHKLIDTLKLFGIDATLAYTVQGPVVTKYAIQLAPGIRYSSVTNIADNIKGSLHAKSLRIEAPIPGEECIGIEVPNRASAGISFREIIESETWRNFSGELPLLFGKDAAGNELVADLAKMPHMLVAGATGQGKSVCLNSIINGLLMTKTPEQLKLIMVDPKSVEFTSYASIPHLIVPVITDNRKVVFSLHWAVAEMEKRLKMFARAKVRNIYDFNHRLQFTQTDMFGQDSEVGSDMPKTVPYIVIIIDEVADLMAAAAKEVVPDISRLTAKARAAGIHLILATQRPDAKVITGTIKANIPGRVAFKTATSIDSRTILDDTGAENLIGKGDMLFRTAQGLLVRAQGAWISDPEINRITSFIEQHANTQFDEKFATKLSRVKEAGIADPFADNADDPDNQQPSDTDAQAAREQVKADAAASDFLKAVECVINTKRASTSHFQRQLGWGYNHAAKILDMLEAKGIVGPQSGAGPRPIIMDQDQLLAIFNGSGASAGEGASASPQEDSSTSTDEIPLTEENT